MKENTYYLFDNGMKIAFSGSFERLLNKTTKTENARATKTRVAFIIYTMQTKIKELWIAADLKKLLATTPLSERLC